MLITGSNCGYITPTADIALAILIVPQRDNRAVTIYYNDMAIKDTAGGNTPLILGNPFTRFCQLFCRFRFVRLCHKSYLKRNISSSSLPQALHFLVNKPLFVLKSHYHKYAGSIKTR
jgi:hypothetical protein